MKAILIATAALMTGAGIYGLVDYNRRSETSEFKELYTHEKPGAQNSAAPETLRDVKTNGLQRKEPATTIENEMAKTKTSGRKSVRKKKKLSFKTFSRAEPEEVIVEKK